MGTSLLWAAGGTGFTFLMTTLGASVVFFFRKEVNASVQRIFLGFAAGVMIAASVWSLLIPAIEEASLNGGIGWIPAAGGFLLGVFFLIALDTYLPHLHPDCSNPGCNEAEGVSSSWKRRPLPRYTAQHGNDPALYTAAMALAIGIGIQNFPEGAAISLPLRQEGLSTGKAFFRGSMSGIVEPVFGILTVLVAGAIEPLMPWLLSFAAGAMLYVVVEELIPEAHLGEHSNAGTLGVMGGFVIMMILDVALG